MAEPFEEVSPGIEKPEQGLTTLAGILISLLVAIIAGAGVWGYYQYKVIPDLERKAATTTITPSQEAKTNETKDWQTYASKTDNYSFKYPTEFYAYDDCYNITTKIREEIDSPAKGVLIENKNMGEQFPPCESDYAQAYFTVTASNEEINLDEQKAGSTTDIESEVKVGGQTWLKLILTEPSEMDGSYITVLHTNYNNKGYTISWENSDAKGTHEATIDKILDTFQFTK